MVDLNYYIKGIRNGLPFQNKIISFSFWGLWVVTQLGPGPAGSLVVRGSSHVTAVRRPAITGMPASLVARLANTSHAYLFENKELASSSLCECVEDKPGSSGVEPDPLLLANSWSLEKFRHVF